MKHKLYILIILIITNLTYAIAEGNDYDKLEDDMALCPTYSKEDLIQYIHDNFKPENGLVFPTYYPYDLPVDLKKIYLPGTVNNYDPRWTGGYTQVLNYARYIQEYNRYKQADYCRYNVDKERGYKRGPYYDFRNGSHKGQSVKLAPTYLSDAPCEGGLPIDNMRACKCIKGMNPSDPGYNPKIDCKNHTPIGEDKRFTTHGKPFEQNGVTMQSSLFFIVAGVDIRRKNSCDSGDENWIPRPGYWSEVIPDVKDGKLYFTNTFTKFEKEKFYQDDAQYEYNRNNLYYKIWRLYHRLNRFNTEYGDLCNCGWSSAWAPMVAFMPWQAFHVALKKTPNPACFVNTQDILYPNTRNSGNLNLSVFRTNLEKGKLCLYAEEVGFTSFVDCRVAPESVKPDPPKLSCFMDAPECNFSNMADPTNAQWLLPFSSKIVQCVVSATNAIFQGSKECNSLGEQWHDTLFGKLQKNIKGAVLAVLALYIVFVGIKVITGEYHEKKDFFGFFIKLIIVMYFSIGTGWMDYYRIIIESLQDIIAIVLDASLQANNHLNYCHFPSESYSEGWSMLRLWDILDCKIYYYAGFGHDGTAASAFEVPALLTRIFTSNALSFFTAVIMFFIGILLCYLIICIIRDYVVSIFAISILVYIAPIFVPMVLFAPTKKMFNSWKNQLVGYLIMPIVLMSFLGLFLFTFDKIYWGDAGSEVTIKDFNPKNAYFDLNCYDKNNNFIQSSLGCVVSEGHKFAGGIDAVMTFLKVLLLLFAFTIFMNDLSQFVQSLTGVQQTIGTLGSTNYLMNGMSGLLSVASSSSKGKKGKDKGQDKDQGKDKDNKEQFSHESSQKSKALTDDERDDQQEQARENEE